MAAGVRGRKELVMIQWLKSAILDTPLEGIARRLYIRMDKNDRETLAIMRLLLRKNSNCVDIGAHRGSILGEIVSIAPDGIHYAFEPVPKHYQYLCRTFPKVNVLPFALNNHEKQEIFVHNLSHPTRSGFQNVIHADSDAIETILVETKPLDQIIPPDLHVDFIKIDVEGAEALVIEGGLQTILRNRPIIVFEHGRSMETGPESASMKIYRLLVEEGGLRISSLAGWIQRETGMSREEFCDKTDQGKLFYFIAFPA